MSVMKAACSEGTHWLRSATTTIPPNRQSVNLNMLNTIVCSLEWKLVYLTKQSSIGPLSLSMEFHRSRPD